MDWLRGQRGQRDVVDTCVLRYVCMCIEYRVLMHCIWAVTKQHSQHTYTHTQREIRHTGVTVAIQNQTNTIVSTTGHAHHTRMLYAWKCVYWNRYEVGVGARISILPSLFFCSCCLYSICRHRRRRDEILFERMWHAWNHHCARCVCPTTHWNRVRLCVGIWLFIRLPRVWDECVVIPISQQSEHTFSRSGLLVECKWAWNTKNNKIVKYEYLVMRLAGLHCRRTIATMKLCTFHRMHLFRLLLVFMVIIALHNDWLTSIAVRYCTKTCFIVRLPVKYHRIYFLFDTLENMV